MTNERAERVHWSLVVAHMIFVTYHHRRHKGVYCNALLLAHWSVCQKQTMTVHFSSVKSLCARL